MPPVHYHHGRLPPDRLDLQRLLPLVGPANRALARYDGLLAAVPNMELLLAPLTIQEAVLSSRIEGIETTVGGVLEFEAGGDVASAQQRADFQEVLNHRAALSYAVEQLPTLPLSQRLIRETHRVLMQGVRGEHKSPGEYRRGLAWIGGRNSTIETADFVPLEAERLVEGMTALERYVHDEAPDRLIQLAIVHVEFESIHPFADGNGRLGRLLVPLFLVEKGLLSYPTFYLSQYLEAHRDDYYDRLLTVSRDGDWTGWCEFFLTAVTAQAHADQAKASAVLDLYQQWKPRFSDLTRSHHAIRALDWFFNRPVFSTSFFIESSGIPKPTGNRLVQVAREHGLLRELRPARGRRPAILAFPELINISEGRTLL